MLNLRSEIVELEYVNKIEKLIMKFFKITVLHKNIYSFFSHVGRVFQGLILKDGFVKIPFYKKSKLYPFVSKETFHDMV